MVNRIYLHLVLHGIFRHMLRRKGREERIYHLACDIVAESIIDGLQYRCVMKGRSLPRREMYRMLKKKMKTLTAERVYEVLKKEEFPETKLGQLESDFRVDDHSYWPKDEDKKKQSQIENQWQDISERMETEMGDIFQRGIGKFGRSDRSGEGREPGTDGLPGILTEVFGFKRRDDGRPGFF